MKHVFLINNHMMFLMAMKVIEHEEIAPQNVILLGVRQYPFTPEIAHKYPHNYQYNSFHIPELGSIRALLGMALAHPRKIADLIDSADNMLKRHLANDRFHLYIPHNNGLDIEVLMSMPECDSVSYLEEGSLAYACTPESNFRKCPFNQRASFFLLRLLSKGRVGKLGNCNFATHLPKFSNFYCAFGDAFRGFPNRRETGSPFQTVSGLPDGLHAIIVFDGGIVPPEQIRQSIEISCRHAAEIRHHRQIYYKFHPAQRPDGRDGWRKRFEELSRLYGVGINELPDGILLENIAFTLKDKLDVYIICSSVGIYSEYCGCNVFTSAGRFAADNPKLQRHYDLYGHIFKRYQEI